MSHVLFIGLAIFCAIHIVRDIAQIKYGYNNWFTKVGDIWHAPQYEIHGIVVFALLSMLFLYLGTRLRPSIAAQVHISLQA